MSVEEKKNELLNIFPRDAIVQYDSGVNGVKDAYSDHPELGWTSKTDNFFYEKKAKDIFLFAMCYGKHHNFQEKFTSSKARSGGIRLTAFDMPDLWLIMSIGIETITQEQPEPTLDFVEPENGRRILETCMEYANGGMKGLMRLMKENSGKDFEGFEGELDDILDVLNNE